MSEIHQGQNVIILGDYSQDAEKIVILLHGRGAKAESMVSLVEAIALDGVRYYLPQAASNRWYPQTAFGPTADNEPDLTSALDLVGELINRAQREGFNRDSIFLGGFSQGACLAAEYLVRKPRKIGGLFVLSGALIGPPGQPRTPVGNLDSTPVLIAGSENDPWVDKALISEAARVFDELGADVNLIIYPNMGHTINADEIMRIRDLIDYHPSQPIEGK